MATQIIQKILDEIKSMMSRFESLIRTAISNLEALGERVAGEIKTTSEEIFTTVRQRMSNAIQAFKNKLDTKVFHAGSPGTSASSFNSRIHNMLRDLIDDLQVIFDRMKNILKDILGDSERAIKDVEGKMTTVVKDTADITDTVGKDFLRALEQVGRDTEATFAKGTEALVHNVEADASFVKNHGLQIAETATIAVINPYVVLSFIASGAMIYGGAIYEP